MIPAAAQTLAEILSSGTSLVSTEQIDFDHPGQRQNLRPGLNLYCYDLRESNTIQCSSQLVSGMNLQAQPDSSLENHHLRWFNVAFLVSAWDFTALGEQHLLSEALTLLLPHRSLREDLLVPVLRGYGNLSMTVSADLAINAVALWSALGVPLRPALYVTVTIPFSLRGEIAPKKRLLTPTP